MRTPTINSNVIISGVIIGAAIFLSYSIVSQANIPQVNAQAGSNIVFPVKELGNCKNEGECRIYCDKPENISACVNFAEKNNLMSPEEAARAKAFAKAGTGPGNCKGKDECESFCNDQANFETCLNFAETHGLISADELKGARQVAGALREGAKLPGGCRGKAECETYCDDPSHINECLDFAEKAAFISGDELKEARQAARAISSGITPPGNCRGKKGCDAYCSEPSHMEECLNFAEAAGFIPKEEVEQARRVMPLMMRGETPGGCRGKAECETYCGDGSHAEECANFAIKAGFMKPEEAEIFKKTGGKGPGGCRGKEECETFCNNPANQETCFNFAKDKGLIPEEKIKEMKEGMTKMREGLGQAPPEVTDCIRSKVGTENFDKIQANTLMPGRQIGDQVRDCFEKFVPQEMMGPGGPKGMPGGPEGIPQGQFKGPGGCTNPEECVKYCSDPSHQEECGKFGGGKIPAGMPTEEGERQRMMPQGLKPPEGMMPQGIPEEYRKMLEQGQTPPGFTPPPGTNYPIPPPGTNIPPEYQNMMQQYQMMPPPTGETPPTPTETTPPQSLLRYSPFALLLKTFLGR